LPQLLEATQAEGFNTLDPANEAAVLVKEAE